MSLVESKSNRKILAEEAYERIRYELFNFLLLPGDRFTEQQLCDRLSVSRTPVRQALFRLQQEGHVEVLFRNGWRVLPIDFKKFDALYDFRILIETEAAQRLSEGRISGDMAVSNQLLQELADFWLVPQASRIYDAAAVSQRDEEFHCTLVAAAGNPVMQNTHREITERIRVIRKLDFTYQPRIDATYDEHARILKAILDKRSEQARLLLKAHIESSQIEVRKLTLHQLHLAREI
jgi:DNA-binding GntR family transcriptional regulator